MPCFLTENASISSSKSPLSTSRSLPHSCVSSAAAILCGFLAPTPIFSLENPLNVTETIDNQKENRQKWLFTSVPEVTSKISCNREIHAESFGAKFKASQTTHYAYTGKYGAPRMQEYPGMKGIVRTQGYFVVKGLKQIVLQFLLIHSRCLDLTPI